MARLTSEFWVAAYLRRVRLEGAFPVLVKRGAAEAGAVAVVIVRADGAQALYLPAAQTAFGPGETGERRFRPAFDAVFVEAADVAGKLAREQRFDPDLWIVEVEDREGRAFLDVDGV